MTTQLCPDLYQRFSDSNGDPLVGGLVYTYQAGSTTPLATYTDQSGATPNTNPVVLDDTGAANIWLSSSAYKFIIKDSNGVVQRTIDNVKYINLGSIDKTMLAGDIAGTALSWDDVNDELDVQVDNETIEVVSNELAVKPGSLDETYFKPTALLEVIYRNVRDLTCPGLIETIPQYDWSSPSLITNPGTLPTATANVVKWSPSGEFLAVGISASPYVIIYQKSGTTLNKLPNLSTLLTIPCLDLAWSPCGDFLAVVGSGGFSDVKTIIFQRIGNYFLNTNIFVGGSLGATAVSFSPNSDFLIVQNSESTPTNARIFERSYSNATSGTVSGTASVTVTGTCNPSAGTIAGTGSGSISGSDSGTVTGTIFTDITSGSGLNIKYPYPFSPAGFSFGSSVWSRDSSLLAAINKTTGALNIYQRADTVFTSVAVPNVSSATGNITGFSFSPDGKFFVVTFDAAPFFLLYSVSGTAFSLISNPAIMPPDVANCGVWAPNSQYLAIGHNTSPFMSIYSISGTTFTKISDPSTLPAAAVLNLSWSKTKQFLAIATGTTPYVQVYQTASTLPTNAITWTREVTNV